MTVITQAAQARRRRRGHQRLRRRARGRADLRLDVREGEGQEARPAAVAVVDDHEGDRARRSRALRPATEFAPLEEAARSRSEADWIVGMNATRAATIRLRSSFDGAVSLGRVQTPTLAIIARREEEIRAFKPEPYWLVDAHLRADRRRRRPALRRPLPRRRRAAPEDGGRGARRSSPPSAAARARSRKLEKSTQEGARPAPLRPDLAAARRQHALRLLRAAHARRRPAALRGAQGADLPAHQLALPAGRHGAARSSRSPGRSAARREYATAAGYVTGLDLLPLGRVVNDAKVTDHHAIIPTNATAQRRQDERRRPARLRHGRPALPRGVPPGGRVREHAAGDDGRGAHVPHPRARAGRSRLARRLRRGPRGALAATTTRARTSSCRSSSRARTSRRCEVESAEKETKPPRRYSDASLLGRDGDRRQARRRRRAARGDEGLRDRHAGHARGDHRAADRRRLHRARGPRAGLHREGPERDPAARRARADLAVADRRLGAPPRADRARRGVARAFMRDIAAFAGETVHELDAKLKDVRIPRANLGPCPVCGRDIVENRKGFSCWSREDPGCGFVIWKSKAGKTIPTAAVARADLERAHAEARDRVQGPLGTVVPRPAGADADRGRQVARRVRRAVGARGRQAARGRRGAARGRRRGAGAGRLGAATLPRRRR